MQALNLLLLMISWFVVGFVLLGIDRFVDKRVRATGTKVVGPVPFWWVFVWCVPAGLAGALVSEWNEVSTREAQVAFVAVVAFSGLGVWCFRLRYGLHRRGGSAG